MVILVASLTLAVLLTVPGWTLLIVTGTWANHPPLRRWGLAVALSIAFFPALYYWARELGIVLGAAKLLVMLAGGLLVILVHLARATRDHLRFDPLERAGLVIVALTFVSRFLLVDLSPAWADSLHHALLTQATARTGLLPTSMEPLFRIPLAQYHLGVYALTGSLSALSALPAEQALMWVSQTLNAFSTLGVYLLLDRWAGRWGAIVGVAVVGVFSTQPAFYVNFGRTTQLAANGLVLVGCLLLVEAMVSASSSVHGVRLKGVREALLAGLVIGAVFLLHFRVAGVLALLLAPSVAGVCAAVRRPAGVGRAFLAAGLAAAVATLLAWPAARLAIPWHMFPRVAAVRASLANGTFPQQASSPDLGNLAFAEVEYLGVSWLLLTPALAVLPVLLAKKDRVAALMTAWSFLVTVFLITASLHPALDPIGQRFVLLMLYLPVAVVLGAAAQRVWPVLSGRHRKAAIGGLVLLVLIALPARTSGVERFRFFLTPGDRRAMDWIRRHTPHDAVFAINTTFWQPGIAHGTDGGYWIPFFTGRRTTAGCLLPGQFSYFARQSRLVEELQHGKDRAGALVQEGVSHIYIGPKGNYSGRGLSAERLAGDPRLALVYDHGGVAIFEICTTRRSDRQPRVVNVCRPPD